MVAKITSLSQEKLDLQRTINEQERMLDELRKKNTVLKDELWGAIQKWHTIEKDLENQFRIKDTSINQVQ